MLSHSVIGNFCYSTDGPGEGGWWGGKCGHNQDWGLYRRDLMVFRVSVSVFQGVALSRTCDKCDSISPSGFKPNPLAKVV